MLTKKWAPPRMRTEGERRGPLRHLARLAGTFLIAGNSLGATYYVATTGNDSNPGTESNPWRTIQKAANTVAAGDTVLVQPGTYPENVQCTLASGTAVSPIIFQANGAVTNRSWYFSKPYYHVVGFALTGEGVAANQGAISVRRTAHGINVISNVIAETASTPSNVYGVWLEHGDYGVRPSNCVVRANQFIEFNYPAVSLQGQGHLVEGNYFTCTKGSDAIRALSANTTYRLNVFTNWSNLINNANHADIIQSFSNNGEVATNCLFERNFIINCQVTQMGMFTDAMGQGTIGDWTFRNNLYVRCELAIQMYARDMRFYNNTFVDSGHNTAPIMFRGAAGWGYSHGAQFVNNILVRCGVGGNGTYVIEPGLTNTFIAANLVQTTSGGTDVKLVNWLGSQVSDFELQSDSSAIGAGNNLSSLFTDDLLGRVRNGAWEIGALAFPGGLVTDRPGPPRALRIP